MSEEVKEEIEQVLDLGDEPTVDIEGLKNISGVTKRVRFTKEAIVELILTLAQKDAKLLANNGVLYHCTQGLPPGFALTNMSFNLSDLTFDFAVKSPVFEDDGESDIAITWNQINTKEEEEEKKEE